MLQYIVCEAKCQIKGGQSDNLGGISNRLTSQEELITKMLFLRIFNVLRANLSRFLFPQLQELRPMLEPSSFYQSQVI